MAVLSNHALQFIKEMAESSRFDDQMWAVSTYKEISSMCYRLYELTGREEMKEGAGAFKKLMKEV